MTLPQLGAHVTAVQALLTTGLPAGVAVYDGTVPTTPSQTYTVLYPEPGELERSSLVVTSDHLTFIIQITCVGLTAVQARDVLDAVRGALIDKTPTVAGRNCWPITEEPGTPPIRKDDVTRDPALDQPRFYFTPRFRVASTA